MKTIYMEATLNYIARTGVLKESEIIKLIQSGVLKQTIKDKFNYLMIEEFIEPVGPETVK